MAVVAGDDFNGSSSTTELAGRVASIAGTWRRLAMSGQAMQTNTSGEAQGASSGGSSEYYLEQTIGSADYTVTAQVRVDTGSGYCGVLARCTPGASSASTSYYRLFYNNGSGSPLTLDKLVNGAATVLATWDVFPSFAGFDSLSLGISGSAFTITARGVTHTYGTGDSSITAAGYAGIRGRLAGKFDSLSVETAGGGGGTTYNDTLSESLMAGDSLAVVATFRSALSEAITASDALGAAQTFVCSLAEGVTAGESLASQATFNSALSEALTLADQAAGGGLYALALTESLTLADSQAVAAVFAPTIAEAVAVADTLTSQAQLGATISEAIVLADSLNGAGGATTLWVIQNPGTGLWTLQPPAESDWATQAPASTTWTTH